MKITFLQTTPVAHKMCKQFQTYDLPSNIAKVAINKGLAYEAVEQLDTVELPEADIQDIVERLSHLEAA